jgi:hypothetical protein
MSAYRRSFLSTVPTTAAFRASTLRAARGAGFRFELQAGGAEQMDLARRKDRIRQVSRHSPEAVATNLGTALFELATKSRSDPAARNLSATTRLLRHPTAHRSYGLLCRPKDDDVVKGRLKAPESESFRGARGGTYPSPPRCAVVRLHIRRCTRQAYCRTVPCQCCRFAQTEEPGRLRIATASDTHAARLAGPRARDWVGYPMEPSNRAQALRHGRLLSMCLLTQ